MKFISTIEQAFIELLGQEGIPHVLGEEIVRSDDEVLIKSDTKSILTESISCR